MLWPERDIALLSMFSFSYFLLSSFCSALYAIHGELNSEILCTSTVYTYPDFSRIFQQFSGCSGLYVCLVLFTLGLHPP